MDIEKLASLLLKEPAIWCAKDPRHHDRNYVATAWRNIASELETTVELVQKKYKSLRDQFLKELKTAPAGKSGDPGLAREEYTSRWKYFNLFFFLRDDMIGRKSSGNTTAAAAALQGVPQETQESTDSASTDNTPLLSPLSPEAGPSSVIPCPSPSPSISTPSSQTPSFRDQESQQKLGGMAKKKRVTALNKDPGWFSLEETKVDLLRKIAGGQDDSEDIDEDKMFLLSLLPSLRKLPRDQAWDLKIKFAQLLKEELVKTTSTPSQGTLSYQPDATSQGPYSRQDAPSYQPYATSQSHYSRQDAPSYQPDATSQSHYSRQDAPSYQPDATSQGPNSRQDAPSYQPDATSQGPNSRQDAPSYQPDATSPGSYYQLTSPMNNI
ncbi:uncharacterized protein LOC135102733 [Scylla paramamosain]|uniref:uncharacterized protein LOC135102733 n=1 Tax=Scylla paramamosain TaxID=85552 RepID=UPI003083DC66